jgi:predicted nucleic acid-binding protein
VIAAGDASDAHHGRAVEALDGERASSLILPATGYSEVMVGAIASGAPAVAEVERFLKAFAIRIEPIGVEIARSAAQLRAGRRALRLPDALVHATGDVLDAARVLTADRRLAGVTGRVSTV